MAFRLHSSFISICILAFLLPLVTAQHDQPGFPRSDSNGGSSSPSPSSGAAGSSYNFKQTPAFEKSSRILIAHAVLGTLAWAFFAPLGAIFLRLNIPGVSLLKFHVVTQLLVYAMTVATAGLGIWTAIGASKYGNVWMNSHVIIGLVVFSVASIQPWLGWIHHIVFKRRLMRFKKGINTKRPGRTVIAIFHIWIGRILILLGVINGGLGIRLAATTPFQTASTTRKAEIAYGILAGLMFLLFAGVSILFEYRRAARLRATRKSQPVPSPSSEIAHSSNSRHMPFSPMASQDSLELDEKGSEIGRY